MSTEKGPSRDSSTSPEWVWSSWPSQGSAESLQPSSPVVEISPKRTNLAIVEASPVSKRKRSVTTEAGPSRDPSSSPEWVWSTWPSQKSAESFQPSSPAVQISRQPTNIAIVKPSPVSKTKNSVTTEAGLSRDPSTSPEWVWSTWPTEESAQSLQPSSPAVQICRERKNAAIVKPSPVSKTKRTVTAEAGPSRDRSNSPDCLWPTRSSQGSAECLQPSSPAGGISPERRNVAIVKPSPVCRRKLQFKEPQIWNFKIADKFKRTVLPQHFITFPFWNTLDLNAKIPKTKGWTQLKKSVPHKEGTKYGILCGRKSNLVVLDIDVVKQKDNPELVIDGRTAWSEIVKQFRPSSYKCKQVIPTVRTPSGGYHMYFEYNENVVKANGGVKSLNGAFIGEDSKKKIKIDILGDDRCVVAPGSPSYSHWDFLLHPPKPMPHWLEDALSKSNRPSLREPPLNSTSTSSKSNPTGVKRKLDTPAAAFNPPFLNKKCGRINIDQQGLNNIVNRINPVFADSWESWQRIVRSIAKVSSQLSIDGLCMADAFSKKCPLKYKDIADVSKTYHQKNDDVGLRCLQMYATATRTEIEQGSLDPHRRLIDREPYDLIVDLLEKEPDLKRLYSACSEKSMSYVDGVYKCDPITSIWSLQHNYIVERMLQEKLIDDICTPYEARLIKLRIKLIREAFTRAVYNQQLCSLLNNNVNIFGLDNCIFDATTSTLRAGKPDDWINKNAGWKYSEEESRSNMVEVNKFLNDILPVPEEKDVVLSFLARLLSGCRTEGKFLVLIDSRGGHNGKSTFVSLVKLFYGDYHISGINFVTGTAKKNMDSHDAGMLGLVGIRLVIVDETKKTQQLHPKMKMWTGAAGTDEGGRHMYTEKRSAFPLQAGFVICCNEGDFPQFDFTDGSLCERMIAVTMRSKFVTAQKTRDEKTHTYPCDLNITQKLKHFRSSLFDILRGDYFHKQHLLFEENLPASILHQRKTLIYEQNEVGRWISESIVRVEEGEILHPTNMVSIHKLFLAFNGINNEKMSRCKFGVQARAYFRLEGIKIIDRVTCTEDHPLSADVALTNGP